MFFYCDKLELVSNQIKKKNGTSVYLTKGHSFENYFFYLDNLKYVFEALELLDKDYNKFKIAFESFVKAVCRFFAARAVITFANKKCSLYYNSKYKDAEIFGESIKEKNGINCEKLDEEFKKMMKFIKADKIHEEIYKKQKNRIENSPLLYLRGHNVYDYLVKYLFEMHNVKWTTLKIVLHIKKWLIN